MSKKWNGYDPYVDQTEPLLTQIDGHVDGVEGILTDLLPDGSGLIDFTFSLDTSAYSAGDVMAETQVITNAFLVNDGQGVLNSLVFNDKDDQGVAFDVFFLSANVSMGTENSAPSITDADADKILGFVSVVASDYIDLGGTRVAFIPANRLGMVLKAATGTKNLYIAAITRGAPTYTASGVTGRVGIF